MRAAMARCELDIKLDSPRAVFQQGEAITGEVVVRVDEPVQCEGIVIACVWSTRGAGDRDELEKRRTRIRPGVLPQGESRHRFSIAAPKDPLSYDGSPIAVEWRLEARAELPWRIDAKTTQRFDLVPRRSASPEARAPGPIEAGELAEAIKAEFARPESVKPAAPAKPAPKPKPKSRTSLGEIVSIVGWSAGMLFVVAMMVMAFPRLMGVLIPLYGIALVLAFRGYRKMHERYGKPELQVEPRHTYPGGTLCVTVVIEPRKPLHLTKIDVELRAQMKTKTGSGRFERRREQTRFEQRDVLPGRSLRAGERYEESVTFKIPEKAPYSFVSKSNWILWSVEAKAVTEERNDWSGSIGFWVRGGPEEDEPAAAR